MRPEQQLNTGESVSATATSFNTFRTRLVLNINFSIIYPFNNSNCCISSFPNSTQVGMLARIWLIMETFSVLKTHEGPGTVPDGVHYQDFYGSHLLAIWVYSYFGCGETREGFQQNLQNQESKLHAFITTTPFTEDSTRKIFTSFHHNHLLAQFPTWLSLKIPADLKSCDSFLHSYGHFMKKSIKTSSQYKPCHSQKLLFSILRVDIIFCSVHFLKMKNGSA